MAVVIEEFVWQADLIDHWIKRVGTFPDRVPFDTICPACQMEWYVAMGALSLAGSLIDAQSRIPDRTVMDLLDSIRPFLEDADAAS